MLRNPYTRYEHLFVYYLDKLEIPPVDHPDLIGVWIEDEHSILFFHTRQDEFVAELCKTTRTNVIYQADLNYRDWEAGVDVQSFTTKALLVRPVWEQVKADDERLELVLDPSVIFGSGFHPTTRMCLETLELLTGEFGDKITRVADLGTGTGILAVAAAKLGVGDVLAIDNNPLACEVATRNVSLNSCEDRVTVQQRDLLQNLPDLSGYDLVIANLYKTLLVKLFENPLFWQAKMYIISGIIPAMEGEILSALPPGLKLLHRANSNIWRLWVLGTGKAET